MEFTDAQIVQMEMLKYGLKTELDWRVIGLKVILESNVEKCYWKIKPQFPSLLPPNISPHPLSVIRKLCVLLRPFSRSCKYLIANRTRLPINVPICTAPSKPSHVTFWYPRPARPLLQIPHATGGLPTLFRSIHRVFMYI
jgi:hypothetical protein